MRASSLKAPGMSGRHDIELLWFSDCPNHEAARGPLRDVVAELSPESAIRDIDATDPDVAEKLRFPGSPTIRPRCSVGIPRPGRVRTSLSALLDRTRTCSHPAACVDRGCTALIA